MKKDNLNIKTIAYLSFTWYGVQLVNFRDVNHYIKRTIILINTYRYVPKRQNKNILALLNKHITVYHNLELICCKQCMMCINDGSYHFLQDQRITLIYQVKNAQIAKIAVSYKIPFPVFPATSLILSSVCFNISVYKSASDVGQYHNTPPL